MSATYKQFRPPFPFHYLNLIEKKLNRQRPISMDLLLNTAIGKMGLSDWGGEDFRTPLEILITSCNEDSDLTFFGKFVFKQIITSLLMNRLCIQDEIKAHPEILNERIEKPLFIISLPRTGTTLLHNLLLQDPSNRCLLFYEASVPSLHPKYREKNLRAKTDLRIKSAKRMDWLVRRYMKDILIAHSNTIEGPEECLFLLAHEFICATAFESYLKIPQYDNWFDNADKTPAYRYFYKILQLLQRQRAGDHWVLKSPEHLYNLDVLLSVFPDACIVQTHRDLTSVIPSCCSLVAMGRSVFTDQVDLKSIGREYFDKLSKRHARFMKIRETLDQSRVFDVQYKDLINDPVNTVRSIYAYFGYNYDPDTDKRMLHWLSQNQQHKQGTHEYSLSQFGLTEEMIHMI